MRNFFRKVIILFLIGLIILGPYSFINAKEKYSWYDYIDLMLQKEYVEGEVIVAVDNTKRTYTLKNLLGGLDLVNNAEEIMEVDSDSIDVKTNSDDISIEVIKRSDLTTKQILNILKTDKSVLYAEPNYVAEVSESTKNVSGSIKNTTGDLTGSQWGFDVNETYSLKIPNWNNPSGNMNHEVIVAIMDSGIDNEHEDLKNKMYVFSSELQQKTGCEAKRCNLVDDDEFNSHGTHVAGIIGAEWNNIGVSGAASNVKFIDIRIGDRKGAMTGAAIVQGYNKIKIAMENGVDIKIVNNSWGGYSNSLVLKAVIKEVEKLGAVSLFAAGNENLNLDKNFEFPISNVLHDDSSIIVGSSGQTGVRSDFSNYSSNIVDLYAPGEDILSSVFTNSVYDVNNLIKENKYVDDFEDNNQTSAYQGNNALTGELTTEKKNTGSKSLKINLNNAPDNIKNNIKIYSMRMNFGDVSTELNPLTGEKLFSFDVYHDYLAAITNENYEYNLTVKNTSNKFVDLDYITNEELENGWNRYTYALPNDTLYDDLEIKFNLLVSDLSDSIYFDNLRIDEGNKTSYKYLDGTSMATPAVAGALAVLLGNLDEDITPREAKSLLMSYVKPVATLTGSKTNGILDLTIPANTALNPVIEKTTYKDKKIIIEGKNFKDTAGHISLSNLNVYNDAEDGSVPTVSWTDTKIVLTFSQELKGIYRVKVDDYNYRYDSNTFIAAKSNSVFENDLPILDDNGLFDKFDASNDFQMNGYMEVYRNYLYYIPIDGEEMNVLYRYDIEKKTWKRMSDLPEEIYAKQGAMKDGKIFISGFSTTEEQQYLYVYDIATDEWNKDSYVGLLETSTIVNYKDELLLVSGEEEDEVSNKIYKFDYNSGSFEEKLTLNSGSYFARVIVMDENLYIIGEDNSIQRVTNDNVETLSNPYTSVSGTVSKPIFSVIEDGILLKSNISSANHTDMYILRKNTNEFVPYNKRLSDDRTFGGALCSYDNKLYGMTRSYHEKEKIVFRSTQVQTDDIEQSEVKYSILDGDNETYDDNDITIRANGELSKFKKLLVNNTELNTSNYDLSEGSTIVSLKNNYLSSLPAGTYNVKFVYGDGSAATTFTIKKKNNTNYNDNKDKKKNYNESKTNKNAKNPKTSDNIGVYILISFVSIVGLYIVIRMKKKN